jgi:hypothetical protein
MSTRKKRGLCAYCGREKKLTADHVPPKLLLEQPFPLNLLTVPACHDCNSGFKKDDEYTRTVLALDIRANWNYAAQSNLSAIVRSLQRPNARGFSEYLSQQSHQMRIVAPSGTPITSIEIDKQRTNASGLHILRGLYFHETGKRLTALSHPDLRIASMSGLTAEDPEMLTIARAFRLFSDHRSGEMGTAFSYAVAFGDGVSVWLMLLYEYFFWVASIDERDAGQRGAAEISVQI